MEPLASDKTTLRKFGITMAVVFLLIAGGILFRYHRISVTFSLLSSVFFLAALVAPALLAYVYIPWMRFAFVLAWINTRVILIIVYYLFFPLFALGTKLAGVDFLDRKIEKDRKSYWKKKERVPFTAESYKKQS
jgi:hypothetical protein